MSDVTEHARTILDELVERAKCFFLLVGRDHRYFDPQGGKIGRCDDEAKVRARCGEARQRPVLLRKSCDMVCDHEHKLDGKMGKWGRVRVVQPTYNGSAVRVEPTTLPGRALWEVGGTATVLLVFGIVDGSLLWAEV